jgi:homoserine kinase
LRSEAVRVRVPATSANLGPGYDSFALALSLYDDVVARVSDEPGLRIAVHGEGAESVARSAEHLVAKAMFTSFDVLGVRPDGLDLVCHNRIPHGRGLGSSAAAIVAGVLLARALVDGAEGQLPGPSALELAHGIEGHPDNVAACLGGGFTIAWLDRGPECTGASVGALSLPVTTSVVPVVCIPSHQVPTAAARGVLPSEVPHRDAAVNVSRGALLVAALSAAVGRTDLLMTATQDLLHQPYRQPVYPGSSELMAALRGNGIPATISGAGPAVLALAAPDTAERVAAAAGEGFTTYVLGVDAVGATLLAPDEDYQAGLGDHSGQRRRAEGMD